MTTAMIPCAGLGTRLRPLTDELPKPLVWLGDRPLLSHIAARLAKGGVTRAVLNTHHLAERFEEAVLRDLPIDTTLVHEPHILGTAGGVANASSALGPGDVLVWNGDILADLDVETLLALHAAERARGAIATLAITEPGADARIGQGTVGIGEDGAVVRLRGEVFGEEARGADFVGVYVVAAETRARLPAEGCFAGDVFLPALRQGERIATAPIVSRFSDLGTIDIYLEENLRWLDRVRQGQPLVDASANVDPGVSLVRSVVGRGALVRGTGELRDVVVWPGATVLAPLTRAIVLTSGAIVRV